MIKKIFPFVFAVLAVFQFQKSYGQTARLQINNAFFPPTLSLNQGGVDEFIYQIKNIGDAGSEMKGIFFSISGDPDIQFYPTSGNVYYLTATQSVADTFFTIYTYDRIPLTHVYTLLSSNTIDSNAIHSLTGNYYLAQNQYLYLHIPFQLFDCNNVPGVGVTNFSIDSVNVSVDPVPAYADVNYVSGDPILTATINVFDSASYCAAIGKDTAEIGFKIQNTDPAHTYTNTPKPFADSIRIYMYCEASVASLDISSFRINGIPISSSYCTHYVAGAYNMYLIDMPKYPAGLDGDTLGHNTLCDISGGGWADQLQQDSSFEITATIIYQTTCPPFASCGSTTSFFLPGIATTCNNECHTLPYLANRFAPLSSLDYSVYYRYLTEAETSTMTAPADIVQTSPNFSVNLCPNYNQEWSPTGFAFDCPNPDYQITMAIDKGYHLDTTNHLVLTRYIYDSVHLVRSNIYKYVTTFTVTPPSGCSGSPVTLAGPVTLQEFYTSTPYIVINFGKLPMSDCGVNYSTPYNLPCFNVPMILDCAGFPQATKYTNEDDNLSYTLQYVCDTAGCSSCADVLSCANTVTYHHCDGTCSSPPYTKQGWVFERTNYGYINQDISLNHYYDSCGLFNLVPANLIPDTLPIHLQSAYPGDQVEALVNGGFDSIPSKFNSIYLQLRYTPISGSRTPYYLFELDPDKPSYFIVTGCTGVSAINNTPLNLPACPLGYRSCGNFYTGSEVEMNFNLMDALENTNHVWDSLFKIDNTNESLAIYAHINLRVRNDSNFISGDDFLSCGEHVVNLRTEYMADLQALTQVSADTLHSCDSWGNSLSILQSCPGMHFGCPTTSDCDDYDVKFNFTATLASGINDDFPNEFRPFSELNNDLVITLPPGYRYNSTTFYTYSDNYDNSSSNHFAGGSSRHYFNIYPHINSNTIKDSTVQTVLTYIGLNNSCWPLFDQKKTNYSDDPGYYITIHTTPVCSMPDTGIFTCLAGYTLGTQQFDTLYQVHTNPGSMNKTAVHTTPLVNLDVPPTISDSSNRISFTFKLCDSITVPPSDITNAWVAFENIGLDSLEMFTAKLRDSATNSYISGTQYFNGDSGIIFNVGSIANAQCIIFTFSANLDPLSKSCPPPIGSDSGKVVVRFGNVCSGKVLNPNATACENLVDTFTYHVYPTNLELLYTGATPDTVSLCGGQLVEDFSIVSANYGTISNPTFWVSPPSGVTWDSIKYTYPCPGGKTVTVTSADTAVLPGGVAGPPTLGWILDRDLGINGLKGNVTIDSINRVCIRVYFTLDCSYKDTQPIWFYADGFSTCHTLLTADTSILPKVDSSCCDRHPKCYNSRTYDVVLSNATASALSYVSLDCETVLIDGTFTVDRNFYINGCNVFLAPHALINVIDNSWLYIQQGACEVSRPCSHLQAACDTMWRGIIINPGSTLYTNDLTLIEDADTAVFAKNVAGSEGIYHLLLSTFNKNYKDIVVQPVVGNAYAGTSVDCRYTCRDFNPIFSSGPGTCIDEWNWHYAPVDTLIYPHAGEKTAIGWQIDSVHGFVDSAGLSAFFESGLNVFDNLDIGILSYGSNMVICSDTFQNINTGLYNLPAILAIGNSSDVSTIKVGGTGTLRRPNIFNNCTTGIFVTGDVQNIQILDNKMYMDTKHGNSYGIITAGPLYYCTTTIDSNIIDSATDGVVCVLNQNANTLIDSNVITGNALCGGQAGILINEIGSTSAIYNVKNNRIKNLYFGIYLNDVANDLIYQNDIKMSDSICPAGIGIAAGAGNGDRIINNTISMTDHALPSDYPAANNFYGIYTSQCSGDMVTCNYTNYVTNHLYFDNSQNFNVWYNTMTAGADTSYSTGVSFTNNTNLGNQIIGTNSSDNQWIDSMRCKSYFDVSSNPSASRFFVQSGINYNPIGGVCSPQIDTTMVSGSTSSCDPMLMMMMDMSLMDNIAKNRMNYSEFPDTSSRIAKHSLTRTLWNNQGLLTNLVLRNFNDSISATPLGQLMVIDSNINSVQAISPSVLLSSVNGISPTNNIESNLQSTAQIHLQATINKAQNLSTSDLNALRTIANKCPYYDGIGVYQARTLLAYYNGEFTPYNIDNCNRSRDEMHRPRKKEIDATKEISFNIYPNPNNGNFTLIYNLGIENSGRVELYDAIGVKIAEYLLNSSNGTIPVSEQNLRQGLYFYKVYTNSGIKKIGKIVIIK